MSEFTRALARDVMLTLIKGPMPTLKELKDSGCSSVAELFANASWAYAEAFVNEGKKSPIEIQTAIE